MGLGGGQCARLLLWRSEFDSQWGLQFSVKIVEKNENKQKEVKHGPFRKLSFLN